jgi:hypothetical protein
MNNLTTAQLSIAAVALIIIATGGTAAPASPHPQDDAENAAQHAPPRPLRLTVKLDCGTLDGAGRVLIIIDGANADPVPIECTRRPV